MPPPHHHERTRAMEVPGLKWGTLERMGRAAIALMSVGHRGSVDVSLIRTVVDSHTVS
ncbi:hypothetical protein GCM10009773_43380 [Williamsia serinedens]